MMRHPGVLRSPPYVVVDVETTGLGHNARPARHDGVTQIGMAWRDGVNGPVKRWGTICNPGERYFIGGRADEALAIQKRTLAQIREARPTLQEAEVLHGMLMRELGDPLIRSYNQKFDRPFLEAFPWSLDTDDLWGECIMLEAQAAMGVDRWPKLRAACEHFEIQLPQGCDYHDAIADAWMALLLAEKLESLKTPKDE